MNRKRNIITLLTVMMFIMSSTIASAYMTTIHEINNNKKTEGEIITQKKSDTMEIFSNSLENLLLVLRLI